jgi:hypothetical protein
VVTHFYNIFTSPVTSDVGGFIMQAYFQWQQNIFNGDKPEQQLYYAS